MAKFCGKIGYVRTIETDPGLWEEEYVERQYYGDVERNLSMFQSSSNVNDDIAIRNSISIVADPYASENFQYMRYVLYMGTKWKITNAEIRYPRILLSLGGVYNANENSTSS